MEEKAYYTAMGEEYKINWRWGCLFHERDPDEGELDPMRDTRFRGSKHV